MKQVKKLLALFLATMFIFSCTVYAENIALPLTYTYLGNGIEVEISHSGLSEEKLLHIATLLDPNAQSTTPAPCGLTCTLFGHKTQSAIARTTVHKVHELSPRCEQTFYEVTSCERCDYSDVSVISVDRIICCE